MEDRSYDDANEDQVQELFTIPPLTIEKGKILYVIPFRAKNTYRKKNLKITIDWIVAAKDYLKDNFDVTLDILIVEQDREPYDQMPTSKISHLFLNNNSLLNKGWGFNVAVKQNPSYQYYGFCDADIVVPDLETFCDQVVEHTIITPKKAFRPFTDRLNTVLSDCSLFNTYTDVVTNFNAVKGKLPKHGGLSFASNMIFMSHETYDEIGGWDEMFRGWGRFDDFITHKLAMICQCSNIYSPIPAFHLWHPVSLDFSLNQDNVHLYDKYIKYNKTDLIKLVSTNRKSIGDANLYKGK